MIDGNLHVYFNSNLDDPERWRAALSLHFDGLVFSVGPECRDPRTVDIALLWTVPPQGLTHFTSLQAVLSLGAGINQLNLAELPKSVPLARLVDDSLTETMVEYARACVFRYHRCLHVYEKNSRQKKWSFASPKRAAECTVGVLGLGQLGLAIASGLISDGFRVIGWSSTPKLLEGLESKVGDAGLAELAQDVDILVNVLPLTPKTKGILSAPLFTRFTRPVRLINIGRGEHLDESDLLSALDSGQIEAATLDVTTVEPLPASSPLWAHPDILITPHVAGLSAPDSAVLVMVQNIKNAMAGGNLINQIDLQNGY